MFHGIHSKEAREKIRLSRLGKKHSKKTRLKMSKIRLATPVRFWQGKKRKSMIGKNNWKWKGQKASYSAIHHWLARTFGKAKEMGCMFCGGTRGASKIEWANISGKYLRKAMDWTTLCVKCHRNWDKRNYGNSHG